MLVRYRAGVSLLAIAVAVGLIAFIAAVRRPPVGPSQASIASPAIPPTSAGIPTEVDGQRVLVGLDVDIAAASARDASSFLIGIWVRAIVPNCAGSPNQDLAELVPRCGSRVAAPPGFGQSAYVDADGIISPESSGPMVLRVHTRDARAAHCRAENQVICEHTIVAEAIVWTAALLPRPITQESAIERVSRIRIGEERVTGDMTFTVLRDLFAVASGQCGSIPAVDTFSLFGDARLGLMAVFQDSAARGDAQRSLNASDVAAACLPDASSRSALGPWSWVAADNVLVLVAGATADLKTQVAVALSGEVTTVGPLQSPPDKSIDESLSFVLGFASARRTGQLQVAFDLTDGSVDPATFRASAWRASAFAAMDFSVAIDPVAIAPTTTWPDGGKGFTIDHPGSNVRERISVFRSDSSNRSYWQLVVPAS